MNASWNGYQDRFAGMSMVGEVGLLVAPPHALGEQRVGPLEPHGPVHELERLSRLLVRRRAGPDPASMRLQRLPAAGDRLLGGLLVRRQPLGGVVDLLLFPVDPVLVGLDERLQLRRGICFGLVSASSLHVEDQARPAWRRPG